MFPRWPFRVSDPGGGSTTAESGSGAAPGSVAGTSGPPPGREVRAGHLAHLHSGRLQRLLQIQDDQEKYVLVISV